MPQAYGYQDFAFFYDRLTENIDYDEMADYYSAFIKKYAGKGSRLVDLACGTGNLTQRLSQKGFDVIGVDISENMLSVAQGKGFSDILWVCQDMTRLKTAEKADIITCALDSLNHLPSEKAVLKAFSSVYESLGDGGIFLFDMNTPFKHKHILGFNTFVYELDGLFCVWENSFSEKGFRVDIVLNIFSEDDDGRYIKIEESFAERAYPYEKIVEMFGACGFKLVTAKKFLTNRNANAENGKSTDEKWFFVAKK